MWHGCGCCWWGTVAVGALQTLLLFDEEFSVESLKSTSTSAAYSGLHLRSPACCCCWRTWLLSLLVTPHLSPMHPPTPCTSSLPEAALILVKHTTNLLSLFVPPFLFMTPPPYTHTHTHTTQPNNSLPLRQRSPSCASTTSSSWTHHRRRERSRGGVVEGLSRCCGVV